jgi:hypothetical protein
MSNINQFLTIKIGFSDFWKKFDPTYNWFIIFLKKYYNVILSNNPDFLIYSCYGERHKSFNCVKIFYTPENVRPNFTECDYALSFDFINNINHFRLPLYGISFGLEPEILLKKDLDFEKLFEEKNGFCAMVVSNERAKERLSFYEKLSKYKKVDSGGKVLNNIGGPVNDKMQFISNYRFTFAFENSSYNGYVTEKIYEPMFVNSIPLYWGSESVSLDFNTKSFINLHDFFSDEECIDKIMELESDKYKYIEYLKQPWFNNNEINVYINRENIKNYFDKIFFTPIDPSSSWFLSKSYKFKFKAIDMYRNLRYGKK